MVRARQTKSRKCYSFLTQKQKLMIRIRCLHLLDIVTQEFYK